MNACACLGPMYGEPFCYCGMIKRNLPLNEVVREKELERSREQMKKLFEPGGFFYERNKQSSGEQQ